MKKAVGALSSRVEILKLVKFKSEKIHFEEINLGLGS